MSVWITATREQKKKKGFALDKMECLYLSNKEVPAAEVRLDSIVLFSRRPFLFLLLRLFFPLSSQTT